MKKERSPEIGRGRPGRGPLERLEPEEEVPEDRPERLEVDASIVEEIEESGRTIWPQGQRTGEVTDDT